MARSLNHQGEKHPWTRVALEPVVPLIPTRLRISGDFALRFHRDLHESIASTFIAELNPVARAEHRKRLLEALVAQSSVPYLRFDPRTDPGAVKEVIVDLEYDLDGFIPSDEFLVLDVGAQHGDFSVLSSVVRGARVIAFEPVAANCEIFLENIRLNRAENVSLYALALGSFTGSATGGVYETMLIRPRRGAPKRRTDFVSSRLDDLPLNLSGRFRNCLMKIDVEGYEAEVLAGASATLERLKPKIVIETDLRGGYGLVESILSRSRYEIVNKRFKEVSCLIFARPCA